MRKNRTIAVFAAVFVTLAGCASSAEKAKDQAYETEFNADRRFDQEDWQGAIALYTEAINRFEAIFINAADQSEKDNSYSNITQVYAKRGLAWQNAGNTENAASDFVSFRERIARYDDDDYKLAHEYRAYYYLAALYAQNGDYVRAAAEMSSYISLGRPLSDSKDGKAPVYNPETASNPENPSVRESSVLARYFRGLYAFRMGDYQQAYDDFEYAVANQYYPLLTEGAKSEAWLAINETTVNVTGKPRYVLLNYELPKWQKARQMKDEQGEPVAARKACILPPGRYTIYEDYGPSETRERVFGNKEGTLYRVTTTPGRTEVFYKNRLFEAGKAYHITDKTITEIE